MPSIVAQEESSYGSASKRRKLDLARFDSTSNTAQVGSRIFSPFRTLGLVSSTPVPFTSIPLGKTTFQITTSVGRCLQTYDLRRGLNLVFLTRPQTPDTISSVYAWKDRIFAAWGGLSASNGTGVWVFKRGRKQGELEMPPGLNERIKNIIVYGPWIIGCCATRMEIWKTGTYEHYTTLFPPGYGSDEAEPLTGLMCNMPTYLNKIFVGKVDGSVEIWNVSTGKLVYTILPKSSTAGPITALEPTPALDLLAIAYSDGSIVIHNIRVDREVLRLRGKSPSENVVTSISFRTDNLGAGEDGRKAGVMATASTGSSDITLWDLNNHGRVTGVLRGAHMPPSEFSNLSGGVGKIQFLPGQAILVSTGLDNSLKSWILDQVPFSPIPRILHSRSGHAAPITRLQFLPSNSEGAETEGKWIMSAGKDRSLWGWSLRRDGQSTELSQGNIRKQAKKKGFLNNAAGARENLENLRAPEITCMSCSLNRDGGMSAATKDGPVWSNPSTKDAVSSGATGWESVVTGHKHDKYARTWSWGRKKAGRWALKTGDDTEVKSVAVSPCGTFALVGSKGGSIDMYNLQSGQHRRSFPTRLNPVQVKKLKKAAGDKFLVPIPKGKHTKAVTGIAVDALNQTVISTGQDGKIKFWSFSRGDLLHEIDWSPTSTDTSSPCTTISALRYYPPSDLLALACDDDLCVRILDTTTKKLVRELYGCTGQITDFCFSNDGRWIIAADLDSIIRVWDLPTGHLIDAIRFPSACTALAFSPTGEYLATAHVDSIGINLWNNKTLFMHVPTRQLSEDEVAQVGVPTASGEGGQALVEAAFSLEEESAAQGASPEFAPAAIDQLSAALETLSVVPQSRWQTLLNLEAIRERNKPKEAPKAPEKTPFFLPSVSRSGPLALQSAPQDSPVELAADRSRILKMSRTKGASEFTRLLHLCHSTGDYGSFVEHVSTLSPSAADVEIRSLDPAPPYEELVAFVSALTYRLKQRRDYELVQTWMAVFLKIHGDVVGESEEVRAALREWREEHRREGERLERLIGYCRGVVGFLRSART